MISDSDIFEAMARSDENPSSINLSNIDLDESFQSTRVVRQAPAPVRMSSSPTISGTSEASNSPYVNSRAPTQMNSQSPSPVASSLSRNPSLSRLSEALHSPAPYVNYCPPMPIQSQVTSSLSRHPSISGLSEAYHSPGINSPALIVYNGPPLRSLSRSSTQSGNSEVFNSPRVGSPVPTVHNVQTSRRLPSVLSRSSTMPDNLQIVGLNGNLISSPAMTTVHRQSPLSGPSALSRTSSISGSLAFSNLTPRDYASPVIPNSQSSLPATNPRAPPSHPAPPTLSRSLSLPGNSQVFKSPYISGQLVPTRQRPSTLSRSHTFSGNMQVSNAILTNSTAPTPAFLNGQIPHPHLSQSSVSTVSNPLQYSENNKPNPSLKRTRTLSSSSDDYGENVDPDLARHVRKKKTIKNLSTSASGTYPETQPLPSCTYEEVLPTPLDPKCLPGAEDDEDDDIIDTYKIKFESTRYGGDSWSTATPMRDCISGVGLKNPHDQVFTDWLNDGHLDLEVHLVITWPGYPCIFYTLPICPFIGRDGGGVTREHLAQLIGCCYERLFIGSLSCAEGGWAPQDPRWRMWSGGYTFERLRLLSIERVAGNYWQASLTVLTDYGFNSNPSLSMPDLCID